VALEAFKESFARQMAAQFGCAAQFYGAQYALLANRQRGGEFQCRPHKETGDLLGRIHYRIGQQIQRARCGAHGAGSQEKVACRGGQTAVTEEQLNSAQVGPGFE
jgi:hypothetical protein